MISGDEVGRVIRRAIGLALLGIGILVAGLAWLG